MIFRQLCESSNKAYTPTSNQFWDHRVLDVRIFCLIYKILHSKKNNLNDLSGPKHGFFTAEPKMVL